MILTVGGLDLELPSQVVLFTFDQGTPIFHRGGTVGREGCSWWINRTRCGIAWFTQKDDDEPAKDAGTWIPARHATKFARPCCSCWPELRNRPSIFSRRRRLVETSTQEVIA